VDEVHRYHEGTNTLSEDTPNSVETLHAGFAGHAGNTTSIENPMSMLLNAKPNADEMKIERTPKRLLPKLNSECEEKGIQRSPRKKNRPLQKPNVEWEATGLQRSPKSPNNGPLANTEKLMLNEKAMSEARDPRSNIKLKNSNKYELPNNNNLNNNKKNK